MKLDIKIPNNRIRKQGTELNRELSREELKMAKRQLRKSSTSLAIREMQIKTTLRYHFTPVKMAKIKNNNDSLSWRGFEVRETLLHFMCENKLYSPFGSQYGCFYEKLELIYLKNQQYYI